MLRVPTYIPTYVTLTYDLNYHVMCHITFLILFNFIITISAKLSHHHQQHQSPPLHNKVDLFFILYEVEFNPSNVSLSSPQFSSPCIFWPIK